MFHKFSEEAQQRLYKIVGNESSTPQLKGDSTKGKGDSIQGKGESLQSKTETPIISEYKFVSEILDQSAVLEHDVLLKVLLFCN